MLHPPGAASARSRELPMQEETAPAARFRIGCRRNLCGSSPSNLYGTPERKLCGNCAAGGIVDAWGAARECAGGHATGSAIATVAIGSRGLRRAAALDSARE